ncbi:hypothetical protein WJX81_005157 [Elliptochloris bilobata]|uniref:Uncharacterized protein n=1 Tax=Elliptochloris bilobata TaxID=381761 RepID=A0AAW1RUC2_9CHLO
MVAARAPSALACASAGAYAGGAAGWGRDPAEVPPAAPAPPPQAAPRPARRAAFFLPEPRGELQVPESRAFGGPRHAEKRALRPARMREDVDEEEEEALRAICEKAAARAAATFTAAMLQAPEPRTPPPPLRTRAAEAPPRDGAAKAPWDAGQGDGGLWGAVCLHRVAASPAYIRPAGGLAMTCSGGQELGIDLETLQQRLEQLITLLPPLRGKVANMRPALCAALLRDPQQLAQRLVQCRTALPHVDAANLFGQQPDLLLKGTADLVASVEAVARLLGTDGATMQALASKHPRLLDGTAVEEVLTEMRRYVPSKDPRQALLDDPTWLLRLERGPRRLGPHPDDAC